MITAKEALEQVKEKNRFSDLSQEDLEKLSRIDTEIQSAVALGKTYCAVSPYDITEGTYKYLNEYGYAVCVGLTKNALISWSDNNE